jgi:hypothetical protein
MWNAKIHKHLGEIGIAQKIYVRTKEIDCYLYNTTSYVINRSKYLF